jgi:SAM-dependent methyltransferase
LSQVLVSIPKIKIMSCFKNTFLSDNPNDGWIKSGDLKMMEGMTESEDAEKPTGASFWDEKFKREDYLYGENPNQYFAQKLAELTPSALLLPGEGEGRNALFAAKAGWQVIALDQSAEGRKKALALAHVHKVSLEYYLVDITAAELKDSYFEAIGLIYIHLPQYLRRAWHRKLLDALKPGGYLILEGFSKSQLGKSSGGPKDLSMLFDLKELVEDFKSLEIIEATERIVTLDEGLGHNGDASVVRIYARKNT